MKPLEDVALIYIGRQSDFEGLAEDGALAAVEAALNSEPSSKVFFQGVFGIMAADVLLRDHPDAGQSMKDVQGLQRFATSGLGLTKKEIPPCVGSKLDKLLKDLPPPLGFRGLGLRGLGPRRPRLKV